MAMCRFKKVFFLLLSLMVEVSYGQPLRFAMPLKGLQGKDFFIDYYVDHDPGNGIRDPYCGTKTYDGHQGTDFILRSFKTMDSGVYVYAAADGVVTYTHDGEYDRNKHWVKGKPANSIYILHKDGYQSRYLHLMKNSLMVKVGDSVKSGQPLGKVGSSGFSAAVHLHFEVRNGKGDVVDPFSGGCQNEKPSMWQVQPAYDTAQYIIDEGFVPYKPNVDTLMERYQVRDTFYKGQDTLVSFWVFIHGRMRGKTAIAEWYNPHHRLFARYTFALHDNRWDTYIFPYLKMPPAKGAWSVRLFVDNKMIATRNFYVEKPR